MPNGTDATHRTDRGRPPAVGAEPTFTEAQRLWLLERDLDDQDRELEQFRTEVRTELKAIRRLVSTRLNMLVGIGFTLLVAVVSVLITVLASQR